MLMELPIAMLACARIGSIHSVVFASFSAESLAQRIIDCRPKVVITCNAVRRGSKIIYLKEIVDSALIEFAQNGIVTDVCLTRENDSAMKKEMTKWIKGRDIWWQGVLHTTGGYMVYAATTFKYAFDYKSTDIYWCTADCGWITGHSYVTYGPLLNGATVVVFEGVFILLLPNITCFPKYSLIKGVFGMKKNIFHEKYFPRKCFLEKQVDFLLIF